MSRLPTGGVKLIPTGPFGRNITAVCTDVNELFEQLKNIKKH